MSGATRLLALTVGIAATLYALWLLTVGIPVQVQAFAESVEGQSSGGVSNTVRQPLLGAFIPLLLSAQFVYGLLKNAMSLAWFGAVGVLVYGTLSIFGMGIYVTILGLALVASLALHSVAMRATSNRGDDNS